MEAIELGAHLFPQREETKSSINFMPDAVYEPAACLHGTLLGADRYAFPTSSSA